MAGVRKLIEQEQLDCSPAQLALAWCLANPHVNSVVVGARCKSAVAYFVLSLGLITA
jgi:aryl-alcohol dehydrogenase-like predicted oxidoreductase